MDLLYRALDILEFVCVSGSASADEIAGALHAPKSSVYRLLRALGERDYIRHTAANCYEVGPRLRMLQGITERQNRLLQVARPHLGQLSQRTGQTVHLAVQSANRLTYVDTVIGESGISFYPSPSSPLYCTSLGKVLLAYLPQPQRDETIAGLTLEKHTPHTINSTQALTDELELVRSKGYALDNEEWELGLRCIGAPVRNAAGNVIAAISISGLAARLTGAAFPHLINAVCATAESISTDLGYSKMP
jgi:DNA-binding IclR family transcriptional regulator